MIYETFSRSLKQEVRIGQESYSFGLAKGCEVVWPTRSLAKGVESPEDSDWSLRVLAAPFHVSRLSIFGKLHLVLPWLQLWLT